MHLDLFSQLPELFVHIFQFSLGVVQNCQHYRERTQCLFCDSLTPYQNITLKMLVLRYLKISMHHKRHYQKANDGPGPLDPFPPSVRCENNDNILDDPLYPVSPYILLIIIMFSHFYMGQCFYFAASMQPILVPTDFPSHSSHA